ncbi:Rossmann fold domain-containing protein [Novosphingobium sp.]|jgi:hypothetical protein|uniref:Rossmann fold domain-containing protein n=1 Tax=Novosphingobium sp. TaxID=1874826 RepID=UPI001EB2FE62|nr:hypothetical protein [Novosphingobium sp.]MBK6800752.1 hypothetical protein [Novosphingobium sp.]MBK9011311.1 hypothetical protein [Novosphingobium sp.]
MRRIAVEGLPADPLAAAARFHGEVVPVLAEDDDLLLVFPPADHTHRGWRLAAVQMLARSLAPCRVNAVASASDDAIRAAERYLGEAPGLTGQYLPLDDEGAGAVLQARA